ncbi:hypothetical protein PV326_007332 [Microctonus aethiopoides]|nr:hypothetical protein PV326_007332 [Microctonus aethiopoides]
MPRVLKLGLWDVGQEPPFMGAASHQLSATALLGSPDGSRHPLDVYEFAEEDYRYEDANGGTHHQNGRSGAGIWECLRGCRHRLDQQLARRRSFCRATYSKNEGKKKKQLGEELKGLLGYSVATNVA